MMKVTVIALALLLLWPALSMSQELRAPLKQLKTFSQQKYHDTSIKPLTEFGKIYTLSGLNYLAPLAVRLILPDSINARQCYETAIDCSFAGAYEMSLFYERKMYDSMPASAYHDARLYADTLNSVSFGTASEYIISRTSSERVIMINEVSYKPQHRAFLSLLLPGLYDQGFRYLAMEMLTGQNENPIQTVTPQTGYLCVEPTLAELIRNALKIGFTLVPIDDSISSKYAATSRAAIQARNIASLLQKDSSSRVIVFGGLTTIGERTLGDLHWPMAYQLRRISGIDPLTIDQTEMTEGSNFEYGRIFHAYLTERLILEKPMIAFRNNQPISLLDNDQFDLQVIHPPVKYLHNRPVWLSNDSTRKKFSVQPAQKNLFWVQAFYHENGAATPNPFSIPADQTFQAGDDGYYYLYLVPGKYRLEFKDIENRILSSKTIEVK